MNVDFADEEMIAYRESLISATNIHQIILK